MSRPGAGSLLLLHTCLFLLICDSQGTRGDCVHLPILFFLRMSVLSFSFPLCEFLEGPSKLGKLITRNLEAAQPRSLPNFVSSAVWHPSFCHE